MRLLGFFFLLAGGAFAGEFAVLASGARMHIDRQEEDGAKVRLYYGTGFVEMSSTTVRSYEAEEPGPVPVPAQAAAGSAAAATPAPTPLELADAAADRYGLPRELVRRLMAAGSGFQPAAPFARA